MHLRNLPLLNDDYLFDVSLCLFLRSSWIEKIAMAEMDDSPPVERYFVRDDEGLSLFECSSDGPKPLETISKMACSSAKFSPDGELLAVVSAEGVKVMKVSDGKQLIYFEMGSVQAVDFSPRRNYVQIYQKHSGSDQKNLSLRQISSGNIVWQQSQKQFSSSAWPIIQFSEDESVACRCVTNELQFFDGNDFSKGVIKRAFLQNVISFQLAFSPPSHFAAYFPEIKGAPASVKIYKMGQPENSSAIAQKSFFKSSSARFFWNLGSTAVLILAHADVDKTNQSYYGESNLHFLTSDGSYDGNVPLGKEGPIHDVQWSPSGRDFVVVYGFMPAKATLFDNKCKPIFDFGSAPRNIIKWNPFGRFLSLAGFGNLPGDIEIWDKNKLKKLGSARASLGVSMEWSPTGRKFFVSTTFPRLRVDNGLKLFKYDGTLLHEIPFKVLHQVEWQPAASGKFPDRSASPKKGLTENKNTNDATLPSSAATSTTSNPKPAPYRPPGARNSASSASTFRAQLSGENDQPHKINSPSRHVPPGCNFVESKSALKNKKKREKAKQKKDS